MKELVKRLRHIAKYNPITFNAEAENKAASAIEKQQAELEQVRKERDALAKELFGLAMQSFGMQKTKKSRIGHLCYCPCLCRRKENDYENNL